MHELIGIFDFGRTTQNEVPSINICNTFLCLVPVSIVSVPTFLCLVPVSIVSVPLSFHTRQ